MIDEIILQIRNAEAEADETVKKAREEADKMITEAIARRDASIKDAEERESKNDSAFSATVNEQAEFITRSLEDEGRKAATQIEQTASINSNRAASYIATEILKQWQ